MPHFSRLSVSRKNNQRRPAEVSQGGKRDAGEGAPGWDHRTAGKIMEPSKAIISVGPLAKGYEHLEHGAKLGSSLTIFLITLAYHSNMGGDMLERIVIFGTFA
jgi:hypothetical protein